MTNRSLVLASASPRRRAFLEALGVTFRSLTPRVDELRRENESPPAYARRLAAEKAAWAFEREAADRTEEDQVVLAADTVVFIGEQILEKPHSEAEAISTLETLSGRTHKVVTGVAVHAGGTSHQRAVVTSVRFRELSAEEIRWYVDTGEPFDKAGAYAIQGAGAFLVSGIEGSPSNVVGLPLAETLEMLETAKVALPWRASDVP